MRVLHINFSDCGGAGNAAIRSHLALLAAGVDSKMLVAQKTSHTPEVYELRYQILRKLWRFLQLKYERWLKRDVAQNDKGLRSANTLPGFVLAEIRRFRPDIVHLHWVNAGMMSLREIQKINARVVWTFHDLWPLNGSCHYAGTMMTAELAEQYPTTFEDMDASGYSSSVGKSYRNSLKAKPDGVVTLNRHFERVAKKAGWLSHSKIIRIPNCLDLSVFHPVEDKTSLRAKLGLPAEKVLLLYGAASLHARHKGMDLLLGSLELLDDKTQALCELVIVGGDAGVAHVGAMKCHSLGSITAEFLMAEVYQACDVFMCPSREDNFPNTVAESSSCGLPVVAFRTGGLSDMIEHRRTGYLAEAFSVEDYASGIEEVVSNRGNWAYSCAAKAKLLYDPSRHAAEMTRFYMDVAG